MLTPSFQLTQSDLYLTIEIRTPFAKISETEVFVDGKEFRFYSKPYYLRLNLPGEVVEDGRESAKYDSGSGTFTLVFPKATPGEIFEGLDMLTKLLAPSGEKSVKQALIEVVGESTNQEEEEEEDQDDDEDFDWQIEQVPYTGEDSAIRLNAPTYGFANRRSGVFQRLQAELHDIIDLPDADDTPNEQRSSLRLKDEQKHFNEDHYLSDLYDNEMIGGILAYKPPWSAEYSKIMNGAKDEEVVIFTEEEKEVMRKLPRTEYKLESAVTQQVLLSLVDIIFAYCYNHRTTEGENTAESGWTISKLSATLSWLQSYKSLTDTVITCYRRSLCFPLYRHWELTARVYKDTWKIFAIGKRQLLKCLLEIRSILMDGDSRYILNDLYITDYCVWIQSVRNRQLESLTRNLRKIKISKEDVGFDIDLLEAAARLAVEEEEKTTNELTSDVQELSIETSHIEDLTTQTNALSVKDKQNTEAKPSTNNQQSSCIRDSENKLQQTGDDCDKTASESSDSSTESESTESGDSLSDSNSDSSLLDSDDTTSQNSESVDTEGNIGSEASSGQDCYENNRQCCTLGTTLSSDREINDESEKAVLQETKKSKDDTTLHF